MTNTARASTQVQGYVFAVLLCLLAVLVARPLSAPSSCFLLAVVASSLFGGRGPAWLAIIVSACLFDIFFLSPPFHLLHGQAALLRLAAFIGTMLTLAALLEAKRRSDLARLKIGEEFRSLAETSPDCILSIGDSGTVLFANPALSKMFYLSQTRAVGKPASELLPELEEGRALSGELLARRGDGARFYVEATCGRSGDKTTVFLRDISDRKAAEERLKRSEQNLRLTLETIPGLVYTRTPQGSIEYANAQVSEYLGKTLEEVQRGAWEEALHPEERASVMEESAARVAAGLPYTLDCRLRRCDGVYRAFQTSVRPLSDEQGGVLRWYGVLTDVEERREMEESLRRTQAKLAQAAQNAAISELAAAVVHEISQPLSAMVANGQACLRWLASDPPKTADGQAAVERIVRDGKDAGDIVRGLRSLFRQSPPEKTTLNLRTVVVEVASLLRGRAHREGILLEVDLAPDLPFIEGDKIQLQQVLMNLVANGMDALQGVVDRPRRVVIRARQEHSMIVTEVLDTGVSPPDFEAIFNAFVTTKEKGMGMGLSICRSIIKAHDGKLWGEARAEVGTVFSFALPIVLGD